MVVSKKPELLKYTEKCLLPKLQFFGSIGMSKSILAGFIVREPNWLGRSLEDFIIPNYNFLKGVLLTDEKVSRSFYNLALYLRDRALEKVAPNIETLRELKVPDLCIIYLLSTYPETLQLRTKDFEESISEVLGMGFNPLKISFVVSLHVVSGSNNKAIFARCSEAYSKWGWSKEDISMAFRKHPNCMMLSLNKINSIMEFLVNRCELNAKEIALSPVTFTYSLENKIISRCSVIQVVSSRGLMKKQLKLNTFLPPVEKYFLDKFLFPFEKEVPKLYDFYKGKIGVEEL